MTTTWKTVRVFISSTFRDMQAERDHLVRFVFPRLREQLLPRRIHLVDVDLRWGVTSEQDASEVCREIINECRPRFLCMLGGRYGWVPPGKTRSITADEVHYGVLDQPLNDRGFAYFYFRNDAATAAMVETTPGGSREPQGSDNQQKLAELKEAIIAAGLNPFTYPAQWDNESRRLTGLKKFGDRVYDDLIDSMKSDPELRDRFVTDTAVQLDEFAEENAAIEAFVEERSERFVLGSRGTLLEELLAHASATGGDGYVCLTGAPGSGKSALLAHLSTHATLNSQPSTLLIRHFVGASPGSTDVRRTLRRLCHELKAGCPDITAEIPYDPEKLRVAFPDFLRQACARLRIVILLDAVNQFDPAPHSAGLHWLPEELPINARVILSSLDGPALEELRHRSRKPREIELKPLTTADGEAIIEQFRQRYRKKFESDQRAALLAKTDAGTPLYLLAALEELRTLGAYEEITRRIAELPSTTHELFAWILERLENDDGFRDASGRRVGRELVSRFAALLGASRYGLSQRELADLLDAGDPQGNVAALLHLLRPYLMRRGELLDFYHSNLHRAVCSRFLDSAEAAIACNRNLVGYYTKRLNPPDAPAWSGQDAHALSDLPFHQMRAGMWHELEQTLREARFLEAKAEARFGDGLIDDCTSALEIAPAGAMTEDGRATLASIVELTPASLRTILKRVVPAPMNPCFVVIETGQSIQDFLRLLKLRVPSVASWTQMFPPEVVRLSSLPGLDHGEVSRLLRMMEKAQSCDNIPTITTGGAYLRGSDFLLAHSSVFSACFAKAAETASAIVVFLGASHVPDDFHKIIAQIREWASAMPRVVIVNDAGYLDGAEPGVASLFQGEQVIELFERDVGNIYLQRALAVLGAAPRAKSLARFHHALQFASERELPSVAFLIDMTKHMPDFERALGWMKENPDASLLDCVRAYYLDRVMVFSRFPQAKGGLERFRDLLIRIANDLG